MYIHVCAVFSHAIHMHVHGFYQRTLEVNFPSLELREYSVHTDLPLLKNQHLIFLYMYMYMYMYVC